MKMTKLTRIFVLILSLALLVGSAVGIAASADETDTYAIKAINVAHGDRTQVLIAVDALDVDASEIEVKYTIGGTTKVAGFYGNVDIYGDGNEYPVFYTAGIAAKDCGLDVIAEAHKAGTTPEAPAYKNVSVASYLFGKLYKEGYISATEGDNLDKKNLYLEFIEYIASAEEVLWNLKNPENPRTLLTDINYVYVTNGTVNGANTAILKNDGSVKLAAAAGKFAGMVWQVDSYDSNGNVTTTYAEGNKVDITANSVITAIVDPCVVNFDDLTIGQTYEMKKWIASSNDGGEVRTSDSFGSSGEVPTVVAMDETGENKGMTQGPGSYYWLWANNRDTDGDGVIKNNANVAVLELDLDYREENATGYCNFDIRSGFSGSGTSLINVKVGYKNATEGYVIRHGSIDIPTGLFGEGDNHAEKFTFRVEYMWSTGEMRYSINGEMVYYGTITANAGAAGPIARIAYTPHAPRMCFDNVKLTNTYIKSLTPDVEVVDFSADPIVTNKVKTYEDVEYSFEEYKFDNVSVNYGGETMQNSPEANVVTEDNGNKYLELITTPRVHTKDRSYGIAAVPQFVTSSAYVFDVDFKLSASTASFIVYNERGNNDKFFQWGFSAKNGVTTIDGITIGGQNEWISMRVAFDLSEEIPEFKVYTKNAEGEYEYAGSLTSTGIQSGKEVDTSILTGGYPIRDISMSSTESSGYVTMCFDNIALYTVNK